MISSAHAATYTLTIDPKLMSKHVDITVYSAKGNKAIEMVATAVTPTLKVQVPAGRYMVIVMSSAGYQDFDTSLTYVDVNRTVTYTPRITEYPSVPSIGRALYQRLAAFAGITTEACEAARNRPDLICGKSSKTAREVMLGVTMINEGTQLKPFAFKDKSTGDEFEAVFTTAGKRYRFVIYEYKGRTYSTWIYEP